MEEQKQNHKECCRCGNFERYYTKELRHYEKTEYGFCMEHHKIVDKQEHCACWKTGRKRYLARKQIAAKALNEILMEISAIRQIIQENEEENKHLL